MRTSTRLAKRIVYSTFGAVLLLLAFTCHLQAQVLSDDELYDEASKASRERSDFAAAMMYIYAYIQRNPKDMQTDSNHKNQVLNFHKWTSDNAVKVKSEKDYYLAEWEKCNGLLNECKGRSGVMVRGIIIPSIPPPLDVKPKPQPPPSYPLVCRGGGNLHFTYASSSNDSNKPQISIIFERANAAAGMKRENMQALLPGQCAWLDRAVSPSEPNRLVLTSPVFEAQNFSIQWQRQAVMRISRALYYINTLGHENSWQTFHVFNDQKGNFIVVKID